MPSSNASRARAKSDDLESPHGVMGETSRVAGDKLSHAHVLSIAVPIIIANVTTPIIGFVDTAVLGRLGDAHLIGAAAIGAMIFNMVYWAFGFLRMGTTGLTAQAHGAEAPNEVAATLARALMIAFASGCLVVALQVPIGLTAFNLIDGSAAVEESAAVYFDIRIWGTPAALANYALLGWFIGRGRAGTALALQLLLNGINASLDAYFVLGLGMTVDGVALGTLIAEWSAALCGLGLAWAELRGLRSIPSWPQILETEALKRIIGVNADIFLRTLCLLFAFSWFTAKSAENGDILLAANAVLLQFLIFSAYFLDGFAFAAETLVGQAYGARKQSRFERAVRLSTFWAVALSALLSLAIWIFGAAVIEILTVNPEVRAMAQSYLFWAVLAPIAGVAAYQLDGIFIGMTWTRDMRNMMMLSLAVYLMAWAALTPLGGNHGLWGALIIFFVARALSLAWRYGYLMRATFHSDGATVQP